MILPGTEKLEGVIGTTFDFSVTLYPAPDARLSWQKPPAWNETREYTFNNAVIGANASAYRCLIANTNIQPVGDTSGHWELITPLNLEGYTGEFETGELVLKTGEGITLGGVAGTVKVKAKPAQTEKFASGVTKFSLIMTDTMENKYEYLAGPIKWKAK